jgi:ribulose-5-phosphate 4-epimerase/fuculose-1-phosphate aldolase
MTLSKAGVDLSGTLTSFSFVDFPESMPPKFSFENRSDVTSEWQMHRALHLHLDPPGFVLHTHSLWTVAASIKVREYLPLMHYYQIHLGSDPVHVVGWHIPGSHDLADEVDQIAQSSASRVFLLRNHGCLIGASSIDELLIRAVVLEEACRLFCMTHQPNPARFTIPRDDVPKIRKLLDLSE